MFSSAQILEQSRHRVVTIYSSYMRGPGFYYSSGSGYPDWNLWRLISSLQAKKEIVS